MNKYMARKTYRRINDTSFMRDSYGPAVLPNMDIIPYFLA